MARVWLRRNALRVGLSCLVLIVDAGAADAQASEAERSIHFALPAKKSTATLSLPRVAPRIVIDDEGVLVDGNALVGARAKSATELAPLRTYLESQWKKRCADSTMPDSEGRVPIVLSVAPEVPWSRLQPVLAALDASMVESILLAVTPPPNTGEQQDTEALAPRGRPILLTGLQARRALSFADTMTWKQVAPKLLRLRQRPHFFRARSKKLAREQPTAKARINGVVCLVHGGPTTPLGGSDAFGMGQSIDLAPAGFDAIGP